MAKGDHLFYYRAGAAYSHHGICCGDGTVVHYESSLWMKLTGGFTTDQMPRVRRVSWDEFALGNEVQIRPYAAQDPPGVVLERAMSRLDEADYSLFENNCEHFAVWCKTGFPYSTQVEAHRVASQAVARTTPVGMTLFRVARRVPYPYRSWAYAGALAVAGTVYAGTYLVQRRRDAAARLS